MALRIQTQADETVVIQDVDLVGKEVGDPEVSYTIRRLSVPKVREIYEKHKRKAAAHGREVDPLAIQDDQVDYIVVDWVGMVGDNNQPLPCERLYKLGDITQNLLGLPLERRVLLLREAQKAAKATEDEKRASFRATDDLRAVSEG
jgi:hypothetical protein